MAELVRFRHACQPQRRVLAPQSILLLHAPSSKKMKQLNAVAAPVAPTGASGGMHPAVGSPSYFANQMALGDVASKAKRS